MQSKLLQQERTREMLSDKLHIVNGFCRLGFRQRAALLCWISLSFTTSFGLHGHIHECNIFYIHFLAGFCFAAFLSHGHTLDVSICVFPVLLSFVIFVDSFLSMLYVCVFSVVKTAFFEHTIHAFLSHCRSMIRRLWARPVVRAAIFWPTL
jgi:hypothetical protein